VLVVVVVVVVRRRGERKERKPAKGKGGEGDGKQGMMKKGEKGWTRRVNKGLADLGYAVHSHGLNSPFDLRDANSSVLIWNRSGKYDEKDMNMIILHVCMYATGDKELIDYREKTDD
jgi:hypothetical protein